MQMKPNILKHHTETVLLRKQTPHSLTSVDDFPEEVLPPEEVLRGAVPPAVPELVLALLYRQVRPFPDGLQHPSVLPRQPALLPPQRPVNGGVHVENPG